MQHSNCCLLHSQPDITAPGLNILAAWSEASSPLKVADDNRVVKFQIDSGTSMSCPHVAAVSALLKAVHPDWSSSAIRTAIMTTGTFMYNLVLVIIVANKLPFDKFHLLQQSKQTT